MVMAVGKRGFVLTPHKVSLSILTRLCVPAILEEEEGFTKLLADPIQRQRVAAFHIKQCTEICHLWENICTYYLAYTKLESNDSLYLPISPLRLVRNVSVVDFGNFDFPIHDHISTRQHDRTNAEMRLTKKWKHNSHFSQPSEEAQHVERALLSFGLKISRKLRTQPIDVCRE